MKQSIYKIKATTTDSYKNGRGAQINTPNRFVAQHSSRDIIEGIDDWTEHVGHTQYIEQKAASIVNKVESPDVYMSYSMNAYAGCEHGCIYCYARNVHENWGYSAGIDFEQKIVVKTNAVELLHKQLMHSKWHVAPIMLSGNTDCYQPAEQKYRLTRGLLEECNKFNQPVGVITKNAWICKDKDILQELAAKNLTSVLISITSLNEGLRRVMEPRTATATRRFEVIETLSKAGIKTGVMLGPMIPGLNDHELPAIMKKAANAGASFTAYTFIRLNGAVKLLFHDWLHKNFPDRANKVWHLIEQSHGGKVNDSRWGVRMRGEGAIADIIAQQYQQYKNRYGLNQDRHTLDCTIFKKPGPVQGMLF